TAADPAYRLATERAARVEATMTCDVRADKLQASEWLVFVPVLPTTAGQTDSSTKMTPAGKETAELSDLARPLLLARVRADNDELKHAAKMEVVYSATLWSRHLVPLTRGAKAPPTNDLSAAEREAALRSAGDLSYDSDELKTWQREHKLLRDQGESEIDFARRVFATIRSEFTYAYQPEMDRAPAAVCKAGKSDCGGLSNLLVATLRSQGIPARTLAGRWAVSADPNEKLNGHPYYQYHVKAEFFAAGVGWVPADMASGILHDRSREGLRYFGHDPGDFLTQHIDGNLEIDTIHFGKQQLAVLQRPAFWVTGSGSLDDVKLLESWVVTMER
ncbi:MAG TPA: transglutaminase-like domain-containing protein, partial [Pirellulaceae bacterium]|nr:transglutaminase-like domain-containing protein [Pirellulaceae bacterium]